MKAVVESLLSFGLLDRRLHRLLHALVLSSWASLSIRLANRWILLLIGRIVSFLLFLRFFGCLHELRILTMLNLTVRMVPLLAQLAADPQLAIHLAIVVRVEVDLVAVVTLLIGLEAMEAEVAEADLLTRGRNLDLVELGLLLVGDVGDLLLPQVQQLLPLPLRQVEGAPILVIA